MQTTIERTHTEYFTFTTILESQTQTQPTLTLEDKLVLIEKSAELYHSAMSGFVQPVVNVDSGEVDIIFTSSDGVDVQCCLEWSDVDVKGTGTVFTQLDADSDEGWLIMLALWGEYIVRRRFDRPIRDRSYVSELREDCPTLKLLIEAMPNLAQSAVQFAYRFENNKLKDVGLLIPTPGRPLQYLTVSRETLNEKGFVV